MSASSAMRRSADSRAGPVTPAIVNRCVLGFELRGRALPLAELAGVEVTWLSDIDRCTPLATPRPHTDHIIPT